MGTRGRPTLAAAAAALALALPASALGFGEPPLPATEISKPISLKDGANRKMVKLTAKGGFSGDTVAVDLNWKPTPGPTRVTIRIQFTGSFGGDASRQAKFDGALQVAVKNGVKQLNKLAAKGGSGAAITFAVENTVTDSSAPQLPGYHKINIITTDDPNYRSGLDAGVKVNVSEGGSGTWSSSDLFDAKVFAHEALHLAGLPDRYDTFFRESGKTKLWPAPRDLDTTERIEAWRKAHVPPLKAGEYGSRPQAGAACDVMADHAPACARLTKKDVQAMRAQAGVRLEAAPGDLLANKNPAAQDMGVGAPLKLFAPRGGTARVEGLIAFCIDEDLGAPAEGGGFDVIGPAAGLGGVGDRQLQAVLEALGPRIGAGVNVDGAQPAVWAITDPAESAPFQNDASNAILVAAGIAPGAGAGVTEVPNANAGSPETGALAADGTHVPEPPPEPEPPVVPTRIVGAALSQTVLAVRRARTISLALDVTGPSATANVVVQRRVGRRWRQVTRLIPQPVSGSVYLDVPLPSLVRGVYRVRVTGPFPARAVAFRVGAAA